MSEISIKSIESDARDLSRGCRTSTNAESAIRREFPDVASVSVSLHERLQWRIHMQVSGWQEVDRVLHQTGVVDSIGRHATCRFSFRYERKISVCSNVGYEFFLECAVKTSERDHNGVVG